ncbi:copper chaperone PCu(A)C [Dermabacter vaginalis]|nr:copper chaperone PCu(A)C [Dermabacter vaginalis]
MNTGWRINRRGFVGLASLGMVALAGCSEQPEKDASSKAQQPSEAADAHNGSVKVSDAWVKAADPADTDMTAVFASLTYAGGAQESVRITGAHCDAADMCMLHEVVTENGKSTMREAEGGFTLKAGESFMLEPGGPHIMLMGLTKPLAAGESIALTLEIEGMDDVDFTAIVKDFAGAEENYDDMGSDDGQ